MLFAEVPEEDYYSNLTWDWHISVNHIMEGERPREPPEALLLWLYSAREDARPPLIPQDRGGSQTALLTCLGGHTGPPLQPLRL